MGHEQPSSLASSAEELGSWMRKMRSRAGRGLRELADETRDDPQTYRASISKSSIARYESGATLPPLRCAHDLDVLYAADGWIELSVAALIKPKWQPWKGSQPELFHVYRWPADYRGVVWIDVRPRRDLVDRAHRLELRWGPWLATIVEQLPVTGVTFWTAKDADAEGVAATFSVTSSLPVHVLFGARLEVAGDDPVDINDRWHRADQ